MKRRSSNGLPTVPNRPVQGVRPVGVREASDISGQIH